MSGATVDIGGVIVSGDTTAQLTVVETANTHVGLPSANFLFAFNGALLTFISGQPFIADATLYAAINASSTASALVTWAN